MDRARNSRNRRCLLLWATLACVLVEVSCTKKRPAKAGPPPTETIDLDQSIKFTFGPKLGCRIGDMDTISKEYHERKDRRMLFSIEPVLTEDNEAVGKLVNEVDALQAITGVTTEFKLPKGGKEPLHLGLFICKDMRREGRCNAKKPVNLAKMTEILFFKGPQRGHKLVEADKPYYFQYLLLHGDELKVMTKSINTKQKLATIGKKIVAELGGNVAKHQRALARVLELQSMISSVPLEVQRQDKPSRRITLAAKLPLFDEGKCTSAVESKGAPWTPHAPVKDPNWRAPSEKVSVEPLPPDLN